MYSRGTIVLIPFPFTDLSANKVRPAVILSDNQRGDDIVVAFISSRPEKRNATDVPIRNTHAAFKKTGLKTSSIIKTNKIATLSKKIVLGELGEIDTATQKQIATKLKRIFKL